MGCIDIVHLGGIVQLTTHKCIGDRRAMCALDMTKTSTQEGLEGRLWRRDTRRIIIIMEARSRSYYKTSLPLVLNVRSRLCRQLSRSNQNVRPTLQFLRHAVPAAVQSRATPMSGNDTAIAIVRRRFTTPKNGIRTDPETRNHASPVRQPGHPRQVMSPSSSSSPSSSPSSSSSRLSMASLMY